MLVSIATRANDLILYDRGYPAFWLLALHRQEQRRFCARMLLAFSREVSAFVASGKNSEAVLFTPGPHARQHYQTYGLATDPIPLRLIRVKLNKRRNRSARNLAPGGANLSEHLVQTPLPPALGRREKCRCRLEIENFSGLSAHAMKQDFYAKLFVLNLTAVLPWVAQAIADRLYRGRQYTYRVNFAQALLAMATSVEAVRPDRPYPRKIDPAKLHPFHPNYKRRHEP